MTAHVWVEAAVGCWCLGLLGVPCVGRVWYACVFARVWIVRCVHMCMHVSVSYTPALHQVLQCSRLLIV